MLIGSCNLLLQPLCPFEIPCLRIYRKQDIFQRWGCGPTYPACTEWSGPQNNIIFNWEIFWKIFTLNCSKTPAVVEVGCIKTNPRHLVGWAIPNLKYCFSKWNINLRFNKPGQNIGTCPLTQPNSELNLQLIEDAGKILSKVLHGWILTSFFKICRSRVLTWQNHVNENRPGIDNIVHKMIYIKLDSNLKNSHQNKIEILWSVDNLISLATTKSFLSLESFLELQEEVFIKD